MKPNKTNFSLLALGCVFALSGCERETPTEQTGEMIEDVTEEVGGTVEEAGEKVEDATDS